MIKQKSKLRQRLCRHNFVLATKLEPFQHLGGRRVYLVCEYCGKVIDSYFEPNGAEFGPPHMFDKQPETFIDAVDKLRAAIAKLADDILEGLEKIILRLIKRGG